MYERYIKRIIDLVGGTILFIMISPLFAIIAVIVKLNSAGPVFYRQKRTGLNGKEFICLKFRSTPPNNSVNDRSKEDEFTSVGKILRRFSLDELPQFINVVRGDMSFIGPRPWITEYYNLMNKNQRRRNSVRPGITGLAQAHGRNNLSIYEKIDYDLSYVDNISFIGDLKVIIFTIKSIFDKSSVSAGKGEIHKELDALRSQQAEG